MYHTYRGLFALEADRVEEAKLHLLQSVGIPRSPVVFAFGPNMLLAKQLLERGERLVLYQFFSLCKLCWWFPFRWYRVAQWRGAMLRGELPDFGGNLILSHGRSAPLGPSQESGPLGYKKSATGSAPSKLLAICSPLR